MVETCDGQEQPWIYVLGLFICSLNDLPGISTSHPVLCFLCHHHSCHYKCEDFENLGEFDIPVIVNIYKCL